MHPDISTPDPTPDPNLDRRFARFLRRRRGAKSYADFARQLGLATSTTFRLERGRQSITLRSLARILDRLGCDLDDIWDNGEE
jgi:transcriptional regulator with XRE-family HTH domain